MIPFSRPASVLLVFALSALSPAASAGPLYKCVDAKGASSYQETACPKASQQAGRGYVAPVAPSPQLSWAAQRGAVQRQDRQRQALYRAEVPQARFIPEEGPSAAERAQMAKLDQDVAALGTLNSRGKRELAADLRRQQSQLASGSPVTQAPARSYSDPVVTQPRQVSDQYGNNYTQAPGSGFVQETTTGKTCVKNGNMILECH